jgi:magnesium transporter
MYNIHPLSIEDILHTEQQSKIEMFGEYRFLSIKTIQQEMIVSQKREGANPFCLFRKKKEKEDGADNFLIDQISFIIMKNVVLTFQEVAGDSFDGIRKRILEDAGEIRKMGTDYLAYLIIDAVVDEYSLALNYLEEDIEGFEERAVMTSGQCVHSGIAGYEKVSFADKKGNISVT